MAPIAVGEVIPEGTLAYFDAEDQLQTVSIHSLAAGKKVIIFAVPGAFTPTCSLKHVPGFIEKAEELKTKGVDEIICISVNTICLQKDRNMPKRLILADAAQTDKITETTVLRETWLGSKIDESVMTIGRELGVELFIDGVN